MLEKLITDNKENFKGYYVFAICMWKDKLCLVEITKHSNEELYEITGRKNYH